MSKLIVRAVPLVGLLMTGALPKVASAQEGDQFSIRVESNEVVVPVYVTYKHLETKVTESESNCSDANDDKFYQLKLNEPYFPSDCNESEVRGLNRNDFQLSEDGSPQTIQRVRYEPF